MQQTRLSHWFEHIFYFLLGKIILLNKRIEKTDDLTGLDNKNPIKKKQD